MESTNESPLKITLLSPERTLLKNQGARLVMLTGSEGQIEILPGHINMVGTLETGAFCVNRTDGQKLKGFISSGFFEVHRNEVTITAETLELEGEIDAERAKRAEQRARERLRTGGMDSDNFRKHQLKLQRALVRQQLASRGQ